MKFTEGTWEIYPLNNNDFEITTGEGNFTNGETLVICTVHSNKFYGIWDAYLIAAAPKMYKALDEARGIIVEVCGVNGVSLPLATLKRINSVLADAKGESNGT